MYPVSITTLTLDVALIWFIYFSHPLNAWCPCHVLTRLLSSHLKCPQSSFSPWWTVPSPSSMTSFSKTLSYIFPGFLPLRLLLPHIVILFSSCFMFVVYSHNKIVKPAGGESYVLLWVWAQCQAQLNVQTHKHACSIYSWPNKWIAPCSLGPASRATCFTGRLSIWQKKFLVL